MFLVLDPALNIMTQSRTSLLGVYKIKSGEKFEICGLLAWEEISGPKFYTLRSSGVKAKLTESDRINHLYATIHYIDNLDQLIIVHPDDSIVVMPKKRHLVTQHFTYTAWIRLQGVSLIVRNDRYVL